MASASTKSLITIAIVVLSLIGKGFVAAKVDDCYYTAADIKISQKPTGAIIKGLPEYEVTFYNSCRCTHTNVLLDCHGFASVEDIGDDLRPRSDGTCLLTDGSGPIRGYSTIKVKYAWKTPSTITPLLSQVDCRS
ncbi:hypothetical protein C5167_008435 [Papaver somniferum]|uniref:Uncharacterized protein n=1 Tax=Papaver somniferum TaxID=3469 RepID=A0A4Y7JVL4_PAPSO|nr:uncharacterized protein LOC113285889 [Papaver somniferum]XP_026390415.1 uncharacterized protein LOC113285890 [Papaver somniferum]RZC64746.1 hypothetical protein C5167_008440 [Papaver somniferum]RZC64747.1 hypothetical protein C5167_008435 [Papaver somniferum]